MERVRVAVQVTDPVARWGLLGYLRTRPELQVIPEVAVSDAQVLVAAVDVVDAEVMARLRQHSEQSPARVVLLTNHLAESDLLAAVEYGVVSVLPKSTLTCERLLAGILDASAGGAQLPSELLGNLLQHVERVRREVLKPRGLTMSGLTSREVDMLSLMAEGWDTAEIAKKLSYSQRTVKSMVQSVLSRYGLRNRTAAVAHGIRAGVI